MAYIIAHGTVNGYRKITQMPPIGTEQSILTDIRTEFDNTQSMLNKPFGYLIQMSEKGVWLSIVKLLFDGERSGNGAGFFAFSAFLSNNQVIDGRAMKQILENLLSHYLTIIGDDFTKNVGVDWSFVEQASHHLESQCKLRSKVATTNYKEDSIGIKKGFAYVEISSDAEIEQYLGKPFQPEYGEYHAIFLGTHLQNPNHIVTQKQLIIDFDNEVYEVIWKGNFNSYPNVQLPKLIRKKEIASKTLDFQRQCYKFKTINFSDGRIDDVNETITLEIPKLEPVEYVVKFNINFPDKVEEIIAQRIDQAYQQPRLSKDKQSLIFYGEEALSTWHVVFKTAEDFEYYETDIIPFDNPNNIIDIALQELKKVSLQILLDGKECTQSEKSKIKIYNIKQQELQDNLFNKNTKCFEFYIPNHQSIDELYSFSLSDKYSVKYELQIHKESGSFYQILLKTIKKTPTTPHSNDRKIEVLVPKKYADKEILYSDGNSKSKINTLEREQQENGDIIYYINCGKNISRNAFSFFLGKKRMLSKTVGDNTIEIVGIQNIIYKPLKWFRNNYHYIIYGLVGFLLILLLVGLILLMADSFGVINVGKWFAGENNKTKVIDSTSILQTTSTTTYSLAYHELDSVYQIQKSQWNLSDCKRFCEKYENGSENLRKTDSTAYIKLKQLSWLWRTREKIEKCDWNHLPSFVKPENHEYESQWKLYEINEIRDFLLQIIIPSNINKRRIFEQKIKKEPNFQSKTFDDVLALWDSCQINRTSSTGGNSTGRNNNSNSSNNNSNSNHQPQQDMAGADEF